MNATASLYREGNPSLNFCFDVEDPQTHKSETLEFSHTHHSSIRAAQRGIDLNKVAMVLQYGECFYKQKLQYYILGEKDIPSRFAREKKELKKARKALHKQGLKGSAGDKNNTRRWFEVMKEHAKLRKLLANRSQSKNNAHQLLKFGKIII